MKPSCIAIDIGNTHTDIGLVDTGTAACSCHTVLRTEEAERKISGALEPFFEGGGTTEVIAGTVVSSLRAAVEEALGRFAGARLTWFRYHPGLPVSIEYEDPQALGVDRIADCLYAHAVYPGKDCIIIDAGTTITVDFLQGGAVFLGGAIMPGVLTQLRSLHKGTTELPEVALGELAGDFPGTSTRECISAGIRFSVAGGINRAVRAYKEKFGGRCMVLATGGTWEFTKDFIDSDCTYNPDITLIGTALFRQ
jgi:type III pantothenate kinase